MSIVERQAAKCVDGIIIKLEAARAGHNRHDTPASFSIDQVLKQMEQAHRSMGR